MALVVSPSYINTRTTEAGVALVNPGLVSIESRFSNRVDVLRRAQPFWRYTVSIMPTNDESEGIQVESWLNALEGQLNTTRIPLFRPSIPRSYVVSSQVSSGGVLTTSFTGTGPGDIKVGMRLESGGFVYMVRSRSGRSLVLDPQRMVVVGSSLSPVSDIEVRLSSNETPATDRNSHTYGGWIVEFRSVR